MFSKVVYRRGFLMGLAGAAGVSTLLAAVNKVIRKVRIVEFDANGSRTGVEEVDKDVWIPFVHRPLSTYVNAMAAAGLYVTSMHEPPPPAGFLRRAEEYEQASAFPRLLVLRSEKLRFAPK